MTVSILGWALVGCFLGASLYLAYRRHCKNRVKMIGAAVVYCFVILLVFGILESALPLGRYSYWACSWKRHGPYQTVDLDGNSVSIDLYVKTPLFGTIPPRLPTRVKLVAHSGSLVAKIVRELPYPLGLRGVDIIKGGIQLLPKHSPTSEGTFFLLGGGGWKVTTDCAPETHHPGDGHALQE